MREAHAFARCKLDKSFAAGSAKYSDDSCSAEWDQTLSRLPGEDALSLAIRVQSAYLETLQHMELDDITVYQDKFHSQQLKNRYDKCLSNDPDDPARGHRSADKFWTGWEIWLVDEEYDVKSTPQSLERVVRLCTSCLTKIPRRRLTGPGVPTDTPPLGSI